jgi:hypothetical protein
MHNKLIAVLIGLALLLGGETVGAAEKQKTCYRLKSGKDNLMCRLFLRNLNRICKEEAMVCEPKIHPDLMKYFSVPKWETVDYKTNLDIIAQYIRIRAIIPINCAGQCVSDTQEKKWQEYKAELLPRLESGKIKLVRARIHIKFDDKPRIAHRLVDTVCSNNDLKNYEIARKPGLMIIDEDTAKPDKYYSIMDKYGCYDVFLYQDGAYLIDLDDLPYSPEIYNETRIECHFEHVNKSKEGKK